MPKKLGTLHRKKKTPSRQQQVQSVRKPVGLLVTKELQTAIDTCKEEVGRIAKDCRERNVKYRDPDFDLEKDMHRCVYGLTYDPQPEEQPLPIRGVRRVTEIFDRPKFFNDKGAAESSAIIQGLLGDCYFLAALGTVCCIPGLIEKICVSRDEEVGVYGFIFFQDDGWARIVIDDLMITSIPKSFDSLTEHEQKLFVEDRHLFQHVQKKGGKHLTYAKSGSDGETWVPLIEKAYAKLYGNYRHLDGGHTTEAIEDLSGGVSTTFVIKDVLDTDRFWKEEILKVNEDRLLSAFFTGSLWVQGLIPNHSYSVLRALEWNGKRFLVIRNPWGNSEWTGAWCDGAKEWTPEWIAVLSKVKHVFGNDGQFIMEYNDFLTNFQCIGRTFLFDKTWVLVSEWMKLETPNIPEVPSFGTLSYRVTIPEKTRGILSLSKLNTRGFSSVPLGPQITFEYTIVKLGETTPLRSSPRSPDSRITLEMDLEAGIYIVYVKVQHRAMLEPGDARSCGLNAATETQAVTSVLAAKVRSLSMVKNWNSSLKSRFTSKTLEEVIQEDLAQEAAKEGVLENLTTGRVETDNDSDDDQATVEAKAAGEIATHFDRPDATNAENKPINKSDEDSTAVVYAISQSPPPLNLTNGYHLFLSLLSTVLLPLLDWLARACLLLIQTEEDGGHEKCIPKSRVLEVLEDLSRDNTFNLDPNRTPTTGCRSETREEEDEGWHDLYHDSGQCVFIGLRVYTQTKEPCSIVGKVRA